MAKIQLSHKVKLQIEDDGVKEYSVTFRKLKKKEAKALGAESEEIINIVSDAKKVEEQIEMLKTKIESLSALGKNDEVIKTSDRLEKLYKKRDAMDDRFNELGGMEAFEDAAKKTLELSLGGDDKESLLEVSEEIGYSTVLTALQEELNEKQGKSRMR